jgi:hypothetical protein
MKDRLVSSDDVDLGAVIEADPFDLRVSLASLVHWADSQEVRRAVMASIDFPVDDMPMFLVVNQLSYANRLEAAHLIVRVASPADERSVLLALTPSGRELGERIMANSQKNFDRVLTHWSAKDIDALRRSLARLSKDAGDTTGAG